MIQVNDIFILVDSSLSSNSAAMVVSISKKFVMYRYNTIGENTSATKEDCERGPLCKLGIKKFIDRYCPEQF